MSNTSRDIEDYRSTLERYYEKGLNDGRNEAWECAKECFSNMKEWELEEVFGKDWTFYKIMEMTPQEALTKLEAYEKEQNEIKVGDVVTNKKHEVEILVTEIDDYERTFNGIKVTPTDELGNLGGVYTAKLMSKFTKTGKHIDIQSLLEQIKEGLDEI